MEVLEPAV